MISQIIIKNRACRLLAYLLFSLTALSPKNSLRKSSYQRTALIFFRKNSHDSRSLVEIEADCSKVSHKINFASLLSCEKRYATMKSA